MNELLVAGIVAVKALDGGFIDGPLVRFTDENNPDLTNLKDYFDANTDFGIEVPSSLPVF